MIQGATKSSSLIQSKDLVVVHQWLNDIGEINSIFNAPADRMESFSEE